MPQVHCRHGAYTPIEKMLAAGNDPTEFHAVAMGHHLGMI